MGHIVKLLEQQGETVLEANVAMNSRYPQLNTARNIFFHQPFSHICCLWYAITIPKMRSKLCCILHEASNYNFGVTSFWRALIGTICRFLVIRFCSLLGVNVRGVSDFVCSTYLLKPKRISYVHLFRDHLKYSNHTKSRKEDLAIFWLRRGDGAYALRFIGSLQSKTSLSSVAVLGDAFECNSFLSRLRATEFSNKVEVLQLDNKIDEQHFFRLLEVAKWFVSTYPREGFGLSAFQAASFGCVVLSQEKGAVREWLPEINHVIAKKLLGTAEHLGFDEITQASMINMKFAQEYLKNEN